jgi:hypothetical protein
MDAEVHTPDPICTDVYAPCRTLVFDQLVCFSATEANHHRLYIHTKVGQRVMAVYDNRYGDVN